ncbi:MAG TPA: DinB family protein [Nitriliruptoraceae bacterium]|nr:DinB family protein [Nitriliruptoraceae bacterium]
MIDLPTTVRNGDERTTLTEMLDYQRAVVVRKASGLSQADLARTVGASRLTLAGIVKHLTLVEQSWFRDRLAGDGLLEPWAGVDWQATPDWEFDTAVDDDPVALVADYVAECDRSREIVAAHESLDAKLAVHPRAEVINLRWLLVHMIEETARHAGHADLLRETIDGAVGD